MSKRITALVVMLVALGLASFGAHADSRVGAVNVNKLMEEAPQAKSASEAIQGKFSGRERELLSERDEIRKLEEQYNRDKDVVAKADKDKLEDGLRERLREFKRKSDSFTEDFTLARNEALTKLQTDVYKAIVDVAEKENFDLIVSESVLYASKRVDVTDKVLQRLKEIYTGK
ncbi:MAG: OmpH family outer membrane protein [Thiotrichales bacterium]